MGISANALDDEAEVYIEPSPNGHFRISADPEAVKAAMDVRRKWTIFLDEATGYNSKQRGDKGKEWAKKASKAKSAISSARHFMGLSENLSDEVRAQAESMIEGIEAALTQGDNTGAAGRAKKLTKSLE